MAKKTYEVNINIDGEWTELCEYDSHEEAMEQIKSYEEDDARDGIECEYMICIKD